MLCFNFDKKWIGLHFGRFFTNSSGRPAGLYNIVSQVDEEGRYVEVVPCTICGRKFAVDRIQTHANICSQAKERTPYDVAMMRVAGTEAEELVKAGANPTTYEFTTTTLALMWTGVFQSRRILLLL
jgi:hypothetical protein